MNSYYDKDHCRDGCSECLPACLECHGLTDDLLEKRCFSCHEKMLNRFGCESCLSDFEMIGIATACPKCGSFNIAGEWVRMNSWIQEKQFVLLKSMEAEPSRTLNMIYSGVA